MTGCSIAERHAPTTDVRQFSDSQAVKARFAPIHPSDREALYATFSPLVRCLIHRFGSDHPEMRQDLVGEIYSRFCQVLDAYDPSRGVPLRPYVVRQLSASVYMYARQQWRRRKRETSLDGSLVENTGLLFSHAGAASLHRGTPARPGCPVAGVSGGGYLSGRLSGMESLPGLAGAGTPAVLTDPTAGWVERIVQRDLSARLPQLLSQLPRRQRQVVIWRYFEQRPYEEIARLLQVKETSVRSLLRHGLNNLRRRVRD